MLKIKHIRKLLATSALVIFAPLANATIIHTSASAAPPGFSTYLAAGDTSDVGGWPTPYDISTTTTPQFSFRQHDDIRVGTRLDQNALDKTTDDYEVNKPYESTWASWGDDYWQADQLLMRTEFYHLDTNNDWQWVTAWNSEVDWSSIEDWQTDPTTDSVTLWTGSMSPYLTDNKWQTGTWSSVSFFEGDWDNRQATSFTVVPEPTSLLILSLALFLLMAQRRKYN